MPTDIKAYRVFIASPSGLVKEREAFRRALIDYSEDDAIERGVLFIPLGWEVTLGGVGRPQELINKEILRSDFFILVLWDRWGSPPDTEGKSQYTSGTEEEYHIALECLSKSMRQMVIFFKPVEETRISDPGAQLQKVIDFKKKIEAEKKLLYHSFEDIPDFVKWLRKHLATWARDHEEGSAQKSIQPIPVRQQPISTGFSMEALAQIEGHNKSHDAQQAERLKDEGRFTEAEMVFAQAVVRGDDLDAINGFGVFLQGMGRYNQAEDIFNRVLQLAEKRHDMVWKAAGLNNLALVYYDQSKYLQAEPLFKQALEIRREALGAKHPDVATALNSLAMLYYDQGRYAEAEQLFKQALEMRKEALGAKHPDVAKSLFCLATLLHYHGRTPSSKTDAKELFDEALMIQKKALGPDHPDLAWSLNGLADLYLKKQKYDEAESLFKQALAIREKALGPDHPDLAWSLNGLADLYLKKQKYDEAESLFKRALAIREKALGPDHPDLAWSLNGLAELYLKKQKYDQAEPLFKRALAIRGKALGPDHPDVATSLESYAALLRKMQSDAQAEKMEARAMGIRVHYAQQNMTNPG